MAAHVRVAVDAQELAEQACIWLANIIADCVSKHSVCRIVLAGGSTPRLLYEKLAKLPADTVPWHAVEFFLGDERNVPPDDPQSNVGMIKSALGGVLSDDKARLNPINIQPAAPDKAAAEYESTIAAAFDSSTAFPVFDIVLLGLGDDAHTASLFPFTSGLNESRRWVIANWVEKLNTYRITLTAPVLCAADHVAFLVSGNSKQNALSQVWHAPFDPDQFPAQLIRPQGELLWLVDSAALGKTPLPGQAGI